VIAVVSRVECASFFGWSGERNFRRMEEKYKYTGVIKPFNVN
jgi:hypothetical protein